MRRFFDAFNRRFARFHTAVYRSSGGWVGHRMTGRVKSLLLHTTGRRTGLPRSVALAYSKAGSDYLLVASNFGGDRPPAWFVNLEADPAAAVHVGHRRVPVTARVLMPGDPDYGRLFAIANAGTQGRYERYRTITKRPLPVVRLTPDQ